MINFKYIARDYVPSVDLATLGKTFDTLEKGHQEAIKTASELRTTIANLPMNEQEDGFKQQLVNEIENDIDANTIYGNSYAALDDLVQKSGDILSDGRVIGRIRSQEAKLKYDEIVDKAAIPEGMKQMYKEENPYHYEDGAVDSRSGKVLPGKTWEPNTTPVNTVSFVDIAKAALSFASEEAGGGEYITFLDENGNPVDDISKSTDGALYKKVGTQYKRLPKEKIASAMKQAIASIPGAEDSLKQDYKYALWERNKNIEKSSANGGPKAPTIEGLTDDSGNVYSYDEWLSKKITGIANIASYNHVVNNVSFGSLYTRSKKQSGSNADESKGGGTKTDTKGGTKAASSQLTSGNPTNIIGTEYITSTPLNDALVAKKQASDMLMKFADNFKIALEQTYGEDYSDVKNFDEFVSRITKKHPDISIDDITNAIKYNIKLESESTEELKQNIALYISSKTAYETSKNTINALIEKYPDYKDAIIFNEEASTDNITNKTKYGDGIISLMNDFYENNNTYEIELSDAIMRDVLAQYEATDVNDLNMQGFNISVNPDNGKYKVVIDSAHRNKLPRFAGALETAKARTGENYIGEYLVSTSPASYKLAYEGSKYTKKIGDKYNKAAKEAEEFEKKTYSKGGYISRATIGKDSKVEAYYDDYGETLGLKDTEIERRKKDASKALDALMATSSYDDATIQIVNNDANHTITTLDANDKAQAVREIKSAFATEENRKYVKRSLGTSSSNEYVVTIATPPGNNSTKTSEKLRSTELKTYIVKAPDIIEAIDYNSAASPESLAAIEMGNLFNVEHIKNLGYDSSLGDTNFYLTNRQTGEVRTGAFGNTEPMSSENAKELEICIKKIQRLRNEVQLNFYNFDDENDKMRYSYNVQNLATKIHNIVENNTLENGEIPIADIFYMIGNYTFKK